MQGPGGRRFGGDERCASATKVANAIWLTSLFISRLHLYGSSMLALVGGL